MSRIRRYHDNEDNHNGNLTEWDGNEITGWYGYNYFGSNIQLSWFYYPSWTTVNEFPYLGITYGVLGHFGDYMVDVGFIYIDDENYRNANSCYKEIWNGTNWTSSYFTGSITNIMDVTANTKYYISKGEL
ncbi:MAG: hypothetical protein WCS03_18570 [Bacteroidota bacterium]